MLGAHDMSETTPELSNRLMKSLLVHFKNQFGDGALRRVIDEMALGPEVDTAYLLDATSWISFETGQKIIDGLTKASGDSQFPRLAGRIMATREILGTAWTILKAFGSPQLCYRETMDRSRFFNRIGAFDVRKLDSSHLTVTYRSLRPEPNRHFCEYRMGQLESFPTIWGLPAAKGTELGCQVRGDACCTYEFTWINRSLRWGILIGVPAAMLVGWYLNISLEHPWPTSAALLTGMGFGSLFGMYVDNYRHGAQRDELVRQQNDDAIRAMYDLEVKFDQLQGLNATLDQKVAGRTLELKQTTEKLEAALARQVELDKVKTTFFTNMSHELRTPLTLVLAPLEAMLGEATVSPTQKGELEIMHRNSLRLLRNINSILDISRLDAGRERLKLEPTDLGSFFTSLVESARPMAERRGVRLDLDMVPDLPIVPIDRDKIEKILLNLISNAVKYSEGVAGRRPVVTVDCSLADHRLSLTVRDNGIGIPEDAVGRVFDRFYQVQASPVRDYQGTGIGLALVKELADLHLGTVNAESTIGEGSTFTVVLPVSGEVYPPERLDRREIDLPVTLDRRDSDSLELMREVISDPAALALSDLSLTGDVPAERDTDPGKPLLLLVDDNRDMLTFLTHLLVSEYRVRCAESADEGFRLAVSLQPALVLSDLMMPRRSGQDLLKDLRAESKTRHIPVILLTAKAELQSKIEGLGEGADDYLIKPFHFQELKARIRSLLNQRRLERELAQKNSYLAKLNFDLVLSRKEVFLQTIEALAFAVEAKDPYTHGHSRRVALLSEQLGRQLQLSDQECEMIKIAAVLHDIGKIGIPESILQKPGPLTPEEMAVIKTHPLMGYRILESVKDLAEVNRCILGHHERFDGSGYPARHMGMEIPLSSRVVAVSDTYDAMTSTRVYRKGLGHRRAIDELQKYSGLQFDPDCVRAFLKMYADQPPSFPDFPSAFYERADNDPVILKS
jgi:response regulator RpfG family c-di-GMP phosphodiesterase/signal transduction histidine kinase